ncbi:GGDEF domain-containing protein [Candidatus Collierbacteria bacterium]|nr:GGDEF domain-containing protein [Candidatus Collierbacteria bacterium]
MHQDHPIKKIKIGRIKQRLGLSFLAAGFDRIVVGLGGYLHKKGLISEVVLVDDMTGLFNRSFFDLWYPKLVDQAARAGIELTLVYLDLDGLKETNDRLGHQAGDKLIINFSRLLKGATRQSDSLFRLGGDEFALVLWGTAQPEAVCVLDRIKKKAQKSGIKFSYGLAWLDENRGFAELLAVADERMYEMKRESKTARSLKQSRG